MKLLARKIKKAITSKRKNLPSKKMIASITSIATFLIWLNDIPGSQVLLSSIYNKCMEIVDRNILIPKEYSDKGIDYTDLRDLLRDNKLQDANNHTNQDMLAVLGKGAEALMTEQDISSFPCKDLETINSLWEKFSGKEFGFPSQSKIWTDLGGKSGVYRPEVYEKFSDAVGWREHGTSKLDDKVFWSAKVKIKGSLPIILNAEVPTLVPNLSERIATCKVWSKRD